MQEEIKERIKELQAKMDRLPFGDKYFVLKGEKVRLEEKLEE